MLAAVIGSSPTRAAARVPGPERTRRGSRVVSILLVVLAAAMLFALAADTSAHDLGPSTADTLGIVDHDATIDQARTNEALLSAATSNRTVRSATTPASKSWLLLLALLVVGLALRAATLRWHVVRSRPFADGAVRLLLPRRRGPPVFAH